MLQVEYETGDKENIKYPDPIVRVATGEQDGQQKPEQETKRSCGESGGAQDEKTGLPMVSATSKTLCAAAEHESDGVLSLQEFQQMKLFGAGNQGLQQCSQVINQAWMESSRNEYESPCTHTRGEFAQDNTGQNKCLRGHNEDQHGLTSKRHAVRGGGMASCSEHTCPNCDRNFPTMATAAGHAQYCKAYCKAEPAHLPGLAPNYNPKGRPPNPALHPKSILQDKAGIILLPRSPRVRREEGVMVRRGRQEGELKRDSLECRRECLYVNILY